MSTTGSTSPLTTLVHPNPIRPAQHPAAIIATSFAMGILLDRYAEIRLTHWLVLACGLFAVWFLTWLIRRLRVATLLLLVGWIAAGGTAHHMIWSTMSRANVARRAMTVPKPIELTGTIATRPSIRVSNTPRENSVLPPVDKTQCTLAVDSVILAGRTVRATGRVQLFVTGHMVTAQTGDRIHIHGQISKPLPAGNPGEFDYREYLRRKGIHCVVRAKDPDAIETIKPVSPMSVTWVRNRARRIAEDILFDSLDADVYPIAAAILLGNRDRVTSDLRKSFTESGTMHLLAISGLHVGILALFVWRLARLLHVRLSMEVASVVAFVSLYIFVTDVRPSVLRAGILITSLMIGRLWYRKASTANTLGLAALVLLLITPTDLFDIGAQLSFLSVAAIGWAVSIDRTAVQADPLDSIVRRFLREQVWKRGREIRVMLIVTAVTAPLIAFAFHLYAPIGLLVNVALIHAVALIMIAGYLLLLAGFFVPPLAAIPAAIFSTLLRGFQWLADSAASIESGHRYGPGPGLTWLFIFYAVCGLLYLAQTQRQRFAAVIALGIWVATGLARSFAVDAPDQLRCTVLDVGHGSAVLLESPSGRTMLVDVGSIDSADRAASAVQNCLWQRGLTKIDSLIVTHADLDHFNGATPLMEETSVGSVIGPESFARSKEPAAVKLKAECQRESVGIAAAQRGQRLILDEHMAIEVLHPGVSATSEFEDDNASSLVLLISYAGKRILLTGDVSGSGRRELLSHAIEPVDVLLAPHHGSRFDNDAELNDWANPKYVIASTRNRSAVKVLNKAYPPAESYVTKLDGAVTITVRPDGNMNITPFRQRPSE